MSNRMPRRRRVTTKSKAKKVNGDLCKKCFEFSVVRIVYGFPGPNAIELARKGEIVLGGCMITVGNPTLKCTSCGWNNGVLEIA